MRRTLDRQPRQWSGKGYRENAGVRWGTGKGLEKVWVVCWGEEWMDAQEAEAFF